MTAKELLDAGRLSEAIVQLTQEVKAHPAEPRRRTFLFELLCFAGEYDRAERQLDGLNVESHGADIGIEIYRKLLGATRARERLFVEKGMPSFLMEPPAYAALYVEALQELRAGRATEAASVLERAEADRPRISGTVAGRPFSDFRDCDDRVAAFLEVMLGDQYTWIPFDQIERLEIAPPKMLRDLLWIVARLECRPGFKGEVFLPVLYPGSFRQPEDGVRLGRMTDWTDSQDGLVIGVGQRLFLVDDEDRPMLETRTIEFGTA